MSFYVHIGGSAPPAAFTLDALVDGILSGMIPRGALVANPGDREWTSAAVRPDVLAAVAARELRRSTPPPLPPTEPATLPRAVTSPPPVPPAPATPITLVTAKAAPAPTAIATTVPASVVPAFLPKAPDGPLQEKSAANRNARDSLGVKLGATIFGAFVALSMLFTLVALVKASRDATSKTHTTAAVTATVR